jgi:hypothetical protein
MKINNIITENDVNPPEKQFVKLKGKIKKFDQHLYDKYDQPARKIMKDKLGECITDNPDIYAEDMLLNIPDCKYKYVELQVCTEWIECDYPYKNPYVYERKGHFSDKTLFIIFNKSMTRGLMFDKLSLEKNPRRIIKYSRIFVYDVPWRHVVKFETEFLDNNFFIIYCL